MSSHLSQDDVVLRFPFIGINPFLTSSAFLALAFRLRATVRSIVCQSPCTEQEVSVKFLNDVICRMGGKRKTRLCGPRAGRTFIVHLSMYGFVTQVNSSVIGKVFRPNVKTAWCTVLLIPTLKLLANRYLVIKASCKTYVGQAV